MADQESFSDFFSHMCHFLKQKGCAGDILKDFAALTSDRERFVFVSKLVSKYEFRPSCLNEKVPQKCSNESIRLRNEGNNAFVKGIECEALKLYTKSILFASANDELSIAYANRSAALYIHKHFADSIADIGRAIETNYPENLKFKLIKRKGDCLCQLGKHSEARRSYECSLASLKYANDLPAEKLKEMESKFLASLNECCSHTNTEDTSEKVTECIPSFGDSQNQEVPCASENVKICYLESLGRHIVAAKNIDPGEVIVVEDPFASILLPEYYLSHCYHCLKRCLALMPCEFCCHVMFCSEDCRRASWSTYHKKECAILFFILRLDMGKMAQLALRIVLMLEFSSLKNLIDSISLNPYSKSSREKGFSVNGKYISSDYTPIYHLEGHSDRRYVSYLFKRTCMSNCIMSCLKFGTTLFSSGDQDFDQVECETVVGELILRHLQNLPCNAHDVSELLVEKSKRRAAPLNPCSQISSSLIQIGGAAYAVLSLINHACDPNVVRYSCNGSTAVLRAIRPIYEGEQLLDNYGYHYAVHSMKVRKDNLNEQYFFECNCTACSEQWPTYQVMQETDIDLSLRCPNCALGPLVKENIPHNNTVGQKCNSFFCKNCKKSSDMSALKEELSKSSGEFKLSLYCILNGGKVDIKMLTKHLLLMDKTLIRPWKEYSYCQEAIKHVFALQANCFKL